MITGLLMKSNTRWVIMRVFIILLVSFVLTLFANYARYGYFLFEKTATHPILINLSGVENYYVAYSLTEKYFTHHVRDERGLDLLLQRQNETIPKDERLSVRGREFSFDEREGVVLRQSIPLGESSEVITSYFLLKSQGQTILVTISDPVGWGNADIHPITTKRYILTDGKFILTGQNYEEYNIEGFQNTVSAFVLLSFLSFFFYGIYLLIMRFRDPGRTERSD